MGTGEIISTADQAVPIHLVPLLQAQVRKGINITAYSVEELIQTKKGPRWSLLCFL